MKRTLFTIAVLVVGTLSMVLAQKGNKNNKPVVDITAPANNASFNAPANITVTANATDSDGTITKVEFYANVTLIGTDTTRDPATNLFSVQWSNVAAGSYSLTARATDNSQGKTTSSPVNITVNGQTNNPPTVSITNPINNGPPFTEPATITIEAMASDTDGAVTKVEFFRGATKLGEDTNAPYSYEWRDVNAGSYSLTAKATDNANLAKTSSAVIVTVASTAIIGQWSAPSSWPDVAIHLHVLPNGNVLTWADDDHPDYPWSGTRGPDKTKAYVWDIGTSINPHFEPINNESTNLFCSGHAFLPDGRLLIMGGHEGQDGFGSTDANFFDYRVQTYGSWSKASSMASGRWYPSAVSLANGEVLTVSGSDDGTTVPDIPEVYQTNGQWRSLTDARFTLPLYPFLHLAPNGKVLLAGPFSPTYYLDTSGTGHWTFLASRTFGLRDYGTSVVFGDGKVLVMGGGDPPTKTAEVIDLNAASPVWQWTGSMAYARRQLNATLLPDGKVLATGGTSGDGGNNAIGSVFAAEMWDPATGTWSTMASMQVRRLYHSTAVLLLDGRVLSAGGGRPAAVGEDPLTEHRDAEIYSPPYLFKGARPTISSAPTTRLGYNQTFFVGTTKATSITKVTLIRLSSSTHALNMNQRINNLNFAQGANGLNVTTPLNSNLCPPGHYMLFILNGNGVPSVAKIIQIG